MKVYPTHIEHFSYISCISPTLNVACCYTRLKHDKCLLLHKHLTWYSSWGSCDEWLFYRLGRHCLLASAWQCSFYKLWTNQSTNKPNKHHFAQSIYTVISWIMKCDSFSSSYDVSRKGQEWFRKLSSLPWSRVMSFFEKVLVLNTN